MLNYAARTDVGCHRDNNEDCFAACPEINLWVLADGVGGQDAGEVASEIACHVIRQEVKAGASLEDAIRLSHDSVLGAPEEGVGRAGMASTVVALLVHGDSYQLSWVGDSRGYLWSRNGGLRQISRDHSLVQQLLDEKHITEEEAARHPSRNIVLQALGQKGLPQLQVDSVKDTIEDGQVILMCSDGLSDYVAHADMVAAFDGTEDLDVVAQRLIDRTLANNGADNVTVVLVRLQRRSVRDTQDYPVAELKEALAAQPRKNKEWLLASLLGGGVLLALMIYLIAT